MIVGLALGAFAVSSLANYVGPSTSPPQCVTDKNSPDYRAGCNAPVHVGTETQTKFGWLTLKGLITEDLTVSPPTPSSITGKVLTAIDDLGTAGWRTPTASTGITITTVSATAACGATAEATCPAGTTLISGGFTFSDGTCGGGSVDSMVSRISPTVANSWKCGWDEGPATCFAYCAQ